MSFELRPVTVNASSHDHGSFVAASANLGDIKRSLRKMWRVLKVATGTNLPKVLSRAKLDVGVDFNSGRADFTSTFVPLSKGKGAVSLGLFRQSDVAGTSIKAVACIKRRQHVSRHEITLVIPAIVN